jgi:hypothetical protein
MKPQPSPQFPRWGWLLVALKIALPLAGLVLLAVRCSKGGVA